MSKLIEIQNICVIKNKDEDNEYKYFYTTLDSIDCLHLDQTSEYKKETRFIVAIGVTHGPFKYADFDTFSEAQACYNAIKAAMESDSDITPSIDLLSFNN